MMLEKWRPFTWDSFDSLMDIQRQMNRLFEESKSGKGGKSELSKTDWSPVVDIHEDKEAYYVNADLPGMTQKDISINVESDVLTIKGERKFENNENKENYHRVERYYGTFERSFTLPKGVDPNKIKANFKNGELKLSIPKAEEAKPKQITINVSDK